MCRNVELTTGYEIEVELVTPRRHNRDTPAQNTVEPDNSSMVISLPLCVPSAGEDKLWEQNANEVLTMSSTSSPQNNNTVTHNKE